MELQLPNKSLLILTENIGDTMDLYIKDKTKIKKELQIACGYLHLFLQTQEACFLDR